MDSFKEFVVGKLKDTLFYSIVRRGRAMNEGYSVSIKPTFGPKDISLLGEPREIEYDQYLGMIVEQIPRFKKYLKLDKFSRRLIFQFPMDHWESSDINYMPCLESFMIQFVSDTEYIVCVNFRSSEASRTVEDLALIKKLCGSKWLGLDGYKMVNLYAHFFNLHEYKDGGTSDDFTAKTYSEVKHETKDV
jgi:hypothetical protein